MLARMQVRRATVEDAAAIGAIFHETIHAVNARDYEPAQLRAWSPGPPDPSRWAGRQQTHAVFVAEEEGQLAGFAEVEPDGHVDCFYNHRDFQRRGVGRLLQEALEAHAREQGIDRLDIEASTTARPFFAAMGFTLLAEQQVEIRGQRLTNFRMEKRLS